MLTRYHARRETRRDQCFAAGSVIIAPLVYRGELVGVLDLTSRVQRGVFTEDDVERVRLPGLVNSRTVSLNGRSERRLERLDVS